MDLFVVTIGIGVAAVLGLPFSVASVVLSINHVRLLTVKGSADDFIGGFVSVK